MKLYLDFKTCYLNNIYIFFKYFILNLLFYIWKTWFPKWIKLKKIYKIFIYKNLDTMIIWPSKRKSRKNYHLRISSLTSISTSHLIWLFLKPWVFLTPTYLIFSYLCHRISKVSIYKLEKYYAIVSLCKLSIYQNMRFITFKHHLVKKCEQSVRCN